MKKMNSTRGGAWRLLPLLVLLPFAAQAQFNYTIENNTVTITKYTGDGGAVTIPNVIEGLPVTTIGGSAFFEQDQVTKVTIGNSVTSIQGGAFANCGGLTAISVSRGNPYYSSLDGVLFDRDRITLWRYPAGRSGGYTIPGTVGSVGPGAFADCTGLTSITIGNAVTGLDGAFATCSRLTAISVSGGNPYYSSLDGVLFDRNRDTLLRFPAGKAGSYAIPGTVSSIGSRAFADCTGLTGVAIGNGVASIGEGAFANCSSLTAIDVSGGNPYYAGQEGVLFDRNQTVLIQFPAGRAGSYRIPGAASSIGPAAFAGASGLASVTVGRDVVSIGNLAFANCPALTGVYFEGNAPALGANGFFGADLVTVYYRAGTRGWGLTYGGRPTVLWDPRISTADSGLRVVAGQFSFAITGASGLVVMVEASSDLADPRWSPVASVTLDGAPFIFRDPDVKSHPGRFYRLRTP